MPVELSYPGLKCVLEFLEANKRIHISSRCPRLKHIERCIPLYLNTLYFRPKGVKLNEIFYEIEVDLLIGPPNPVYSRMYPTINFFKQVLRPVERRVQKKRGMQKYETIRDLLDGLMGLRKNIRVDQLVLSHSTILPVPSDFNVKIRNLNCDHVNPKYFLPLIDTSSFPLEKLRLRFPGKLDQPIVQSSEKLVIFVTEQYFSDFSVDILNLPNGSVIIECSSLSEDAYSNIIDYWLDEKRETGKCFMITGGQTKMIETAIDLMKKYDGKMVKWNSTEFSSNPQTNYISIPLNDDLVIAIYAVTHRKDKWNSSHQIVMKTMPINSFIPAEDFSEDKTLIEIKATENPRQNDLIHISSRSPRLKHIERCVPLYLNTLYFRPNVVKLNEITYAIVERNEETTDHPQSELKCGDILIGPRTPVYSRMYPTINFFKQAHRPVERRVQEKEGMQNYEIIRKVLQGLIGERKNIGLDQLVFEQCHSTILRLPSNFKVRIRRLDSGVINPEYLLPLIDFSSFPLKELSLRYPERLDQSIVQSSEKLVIFVDEEYPRNHLDYIDKLSNRSVVTKFTSLNKDAYSNIVDGNKTKIMQAAIDLMKKYNGKMVKWNGTEFRSNSNTNYISIPLNDDFVIGIYAITRRYDEFFAHRIVMKTMPINSFIPAKDFSEDKMLIKIEDLENPRLIDEFTNPLLVIFFVPVFLILVLIFLMLFECFSILYKSFTNPTHN